MSQATEQPSAPRPPRSQLQIGLFTGGAALALFTVGYLVLSTRSASNAKRDAAYTEAAISNVKTLADAASRFRTAHSGQCPSMAELRRDKLVDGLSTDNDPWGNAYEIDCVEHATTVTSHGGGNGRGAITRGSPYEYVPPVPPKAPIDVFAEAVAAETSINGVWRYAKRHVKDGLESDLGKDVLLGWSASRLRWADLQTVPATSYGKAMKDIDPERGKRLCASGSVIEIFKVKGTAVPHFEGGIMTDSGVIRFAAVQGTGDIVAQSYARFCGVLTGHVEYENIGKTTTQGLMAIGMFDLPENRH